MARFAKCTSADGSVSYYINTEQVAYMSRGSHDRFTGIRFAADKDYAISVPETPEQIIEQTA